MKIYLSSRGSGRVMFVAALLATGATAWSAGTPTLKDAYKDCFHVGTAINRVITSGTASRWRPQEQVDRDIALVKQQFNQVTAENEMKWALIHPRQGEDGYNWSAADAFVNFGLGNNMYLVGHTLVWHAQTPFWVFQGTNVPPGAANAASAASDATSNDAEPNARRGGRFGGGFGGGFGRYGFNGPRASREELLARMRDHIHTVVGRYKGRIKAWDVVNEALADDGTNILRNSLWLQIIGPDFIARAFEYAHEADPDAILRYNDYGLENPAKRRKLISLIQTLQRQKVPVMAIGTQAHLNVSSASFENMDQALTEMETLGLPIHVTELDINSAQGGQRNTGADIANNAAATQGGVVDDADKRLTEAYEGIFRAFVKHRASVEVVTFWGPNDANSWRRNGKPLLFDVNCQPKPAFDAVIRVAAASLLSFAFVASPAHTADTPLAVKPATPAQLFPLGAVRLLASPFTHAVAANRQYLLAHDPDRLLAPFMREAGLESRKPPYPNWESMGLQGHTAGHYLSALAQMIAAGNDPDGEFSRRLDYMLSEMRRVQQANGNGYIGGVPGSREFWRSIASGDVAQIWRKWAPWYNVHKTFAGLRDAYVVGGKPKARELLLKLGDWCVSLTSQLSDAQMQQMLANEYGGMNEVMADIYTISGDRKYLETAERFNHRAVMDPLMNGEDKLTGLHANTQIPKIIGLEEIATLTGNQKQDFGARFFWNTVVSNRSVAFGGNSVSEHFNDPKDFSRMIEHREGPETCNTYNMLRLTEKLFMSRPSAQYADFYERALYNHILSTIDPREPGYVYFTPLRPEHYRVYSTPEKSFWCCVGTGMENPGRYGQFIYAQDKDGLYVNLFIASELKTATGITLRQENKFPFEPRTHLNLKLDQPNTFSLRIRHPWWVPEGKLAIHVNGKPVAHSSTPSTCAEVRRQWHNGDTIDVELPMHITADPLPDASDWAAILYGPIVLAAPAGTNDIIGERANDGRMAHVATGPLVPLDRVPCLLTTADELPRHISPDLKAGPLHFRITGVVEPKTSDGLQLVPFFSLYHERYQMYWELTTTEGLQQKQERLAAAERLKAAREAATLDWVAPGEQQSEVEHDFQGERTETGIHNGRRWRHGSLIQYTLNTRNEKAFELSVTYSGDDSGRTFDIFANGTRIATQELKAEKRGDFIEKRYELPAAVLASAREDRLTIKFVATRWLAGGIYDVRLMKPTPGAP